MSRGSEVHERSSPRGAQGKSSPCPPGRISAHCALPLCPSAPAKGGTSLAAKQLRHLILPWCDRGWTPG